MNMYWNKFEIGFLTEIPNYPFCFWLCLLLLCFVFNLFFPSFIYFVLFSFMELMFLILTLIFVRVHGSSDPFNPMTQPPHFHILSKFVWVLNSKWSDLDNMFMILNREPIKQMVSFLNRLVSVKILNNIK
jgi:hypothetical protein